MSEHPPLIRTRLSIAYFLQFAIWSSWAVALGGYADKVLGFSPTKIGWLFSAVPLAAIISPLIMGPIADKYVSAQKLMGLLHLIGGGCLIGAAYAKDFPTLLALMMVYGICYMPTIALCNSVVFKHIPDPDNAPRVFVFGTIGWIVIAVIVSAHLGDIMTSNFFLAGGAVAILLGLYSFSLPDTPPKGASEAGGSPFGLDALKLFKDSTFAIFVLCAFLASIPACGFYFTVQNQVLAQRGFPQPAGLTSVCQIAEIVFMMALPFFVARFGLKKVLIVGMLAWATRYLFFMSPSFGMVLIALILHGFCYSFLYVGAYMYGDKKAPPEMKASVQSLLTFLLLGVGQFVGAQVAGFWGGVNAPAIPKTEIAAAVNEDNKEGAAALPPWSDPAADESPIRFLNPAVAYKTLLGLDKADKPDDDAKPKFDMSSLMAKGADALKLADLGAIPGTGVTVGELTYTPDEIKRAYEDVATWKKTGLKPGESGFDKAKAGLTEADLALTREDWLAAQSQDWARFFLYPSIFIFVILGIFLVIGRNPADEEEAKGEDGGGESSDEPPEEEAKGEQ